MREADDVIGVNDMGSCRGSSFGELSLKVVVEEKGLRLRGNHMVRHGAARWGMVDVRFEKGATF